MRDFAQRIEAPAFARPHLVPGGAEAELLWGLADGGPDYRAFSLYMESKSDYITGMQMYYDVDGVLYLTFYDGMTYTKSPED